MKQSCAFVITVKGSVDARQVLFAGILFVD